jgi:hypothetical protein
VRQHSANTPHEQFTLGPLLDLLSISSGVAVIGTCRSTFSSAAAYFGEYRGRHSAVLKCAVDDRCPPARALVQVCCRQT